MSEHRVLENTHARDPVTVGSLIGDLEKLFADANSLGIKSGWLLNVHSSLSQIGWVAGGAQAVLAALLQVIGSNGTLMMPAYTGHLSDPCHWKAPPVPEDWWQIIRDKMPAFDPVLTATRNMGIIAESFRSYPGVLRSNHPWVSFAARGARAAELTAEHPLQSLFGESSPMAKLYELDGYILLLGVDHGNNSCIHLAEDRAQFKGKSYMQEGAPILVNGQRQWQTFRVSQTDDKDFVELGEAFATQTNHEVRGNVGWGIGRLMRARDIVDFAQPYLERNR